MERLLLLAEWFRHESVSGSLLCGAIAIGLCIHMKGSTIEAQVPILFLLVVLAISSRFGTPAGVLGTVLSACKRRSKNRPYRAAEAA
jgi:K+-sensing histidine kinase KdpD